jgi:hypothetical protein
MTAYIIFTTTGVVDEKSPETTLKVDCDFPTLKSLLVREGYTAGSSRSEIPRPPVEVEVAFEKTNVYRLGKGCYQKERDELIIVVQHQINEDTKKARQSGRPGFSFKSPGNEEFALFDRMECLYYALVDDGENASGAFYNNAVHPFSKKEFKALAKKLGANDVVDYIECTRGETRLLKEMAERAMNQAILIAHDYYNSQL